MYSVGISVFYFIQLTLRRLYRLRRVVFGVRGDFVVVFVATISAVGFVVAVVFIVVVANVVDIVDNNVELLKTTSTLFSDIDGIVTIETLTSLKRFKWKSNCASAKKYIFFFNLESHIAHKRECL